MWGPSTAVRFGKADVVTQPETAKLSAALSSEFSLWRGWGSCYPGPWAAAGPGWWMEPLVCWWSQWQGSGFRQQEAAPQPVLSLVLWTCSSDFTFLLPPKGNQPRGLRRSWTTKPPSAQAQLMSDAFHVKSFPWFWGSQHSMQFLGKYSR